MRQRYGVIRLVIRLVEAVEELVPSPSEHKKLVGHLKQLERPDGVCKLLQSDATTMSEVRFLFDSAMINYLILGGHLKPTAEIVHSPAFETRLVKICDEEKLSAAETVALRHFEAPRSNEQSSTTGRKRNDPQSASQIIQQGGSKKRHVERVAYTPLVAVVPLTSNVCERLFSECKKVITPQRSSMLPRTLRCSCFSLRTRICGTPQV